MEETISILDVCKRYLNPNDTLDPEIFDETKKMHSDLRKKILKIADIIVKNSIYFIPGLKYHDICLIGSSAGYHYHEKSDLDVKIMISNENCDFLTKNPENFKVFIQMMKSIAIPNQKFFANTGTAFQNDNGSIWKTRGGNSGGHSGSPTADDSNRIYIRHTRSPPS